MVTARRRVQADWTPSVQTVTEGLFTKISRMPAYRCCGTDAAGVILEIPERS